MLGECSFIQTTWGFSGAAANTVKFLAVMWRTREKLGMELVRDAIEKITGNRPE
jgi:hypothetical protein